MTSPPSPAPDFPILPRLPSPGGSWFSCLLGEVLDTSVDTHALRAWAPGHLPCLLPPPTYSLVNTERPNSRLKLAGVRRNRDWFLLRHLISKMFSSFYQLPIPPTDYSPAHLPSPCEGIWDQGTLWISWVKVFWLRSPARTRTVFGNLRATPKVFFFKKMCLPWASKSVFGNLP